MALFHKIDYFICSWKEFLWHKLWSALWNSDQVNRCWQPDVTDMAIKDDYLITGTRM